MIKLIKNRSDIGAGTRGSDMGIDAMEIAAINMGSEFFNLHPYEDVETHNETVYNKDKNTFAKRIEQVLEQCRRVADAVADAIEAGYTPIVLSGDHSSALGTLSGISTANSAGELGVIWIDAHADIHSPFTSPSGNIHGMPLAAALSIDNKENQINEIPPETIELWNQMKQIRAAHPKLQADKLVYFGVRDLEPAEAFLIEKKSIRNISVEEVRFIGVRKCVEQALYQLRNCPQIYISFDVDSLDSDGVSDGTGTPVPKGFDIKEVLKIIELIIASGKVTCMEIVEINPLLDRRGNKMAEAAFEILEHATRNLLTAQQS